VVGTRRSRTRRSRGEMVGGEEIRARRSRTRRSRGEEIGARFGVVDNDVVMVGFVVGERSSRRRRELTLLLWWVLL